MESDHSQLVAMDKMILEAEQGATASDIDYLTTVLAENLLFRRADGTVVDKTTFLQGVPGSAQKLKERRGVGLKVHVVGQSALATLTVVGVVDADGRREVKAFRNIRFFGKRDGRWLLEHWYNEPDSTPGTTASESTTAENR